MTRGAAPDRSEGSRTTKIGGGLNEIGGKQEEERRSLLSSVATELVLLVIAVAFFVVAFSFEYVEQPGRLGPAFWPQVICVGIGVCSLASIAQKVRARGRPAARRAPIEIEGMDGVEEEHPVIWSRLVTVISLVLAYPVGAIFLGYPIATALLLIAFMYLGGQRRWYVIPLGVFGSLLFTYVFGKVVYVAVPTGVGVFDQLTVILYQLLGVY